MLKSVVGTALAALLVTSATSSPIQFCQQLALLSGDSTATTSTNPNAPPTSVPRPSTSEIHTIQQQLLLAPSNEQRQAILLPNPPDGSNYTYQFVNNTVRAPTGGTVGLASVDQFPAFIGTNLGAAVGFLNPCGMNVPHSHPRANEFLIVVQGELFGGLVLEANPGSNGNVNGTNPVGPIPQIENRLSNYKGMLFPKGLMHWQFNPTCEPAVFVAGFDNSDPGRTQIAQNFFSILPDDVLIAAVGGDTELLDARQIDQLRDKIPHAYAEMIETCAKKCGIGGY